MIKGLLFDLDGVLADTAKYHYLAWKEIADELGIDFTIEDNELLKGVSRSESFEILLKLGKIKMQAEKKTVFCEKKNNIYRNYINIINEREVLPGVKSFLEEARAFGYRIALGSASRNSVYILQKLQLFSNFDVIIDGTKVKNVKPHPEVFLKGADALCLSGRQCIVFEDSAAGIEAAHRAGMTAVGVGTKDNLPEADTVIDGFRDFSVEKLNRLL